MSIKDIPRINGTLRAKSIQVPEATWEAKGMVVLGRRIKSCIFTTDLAIIRNCNADAVLFLSFAVSAEVQPKVLGQL